MLQQHMFTNKFTLLLQLSFVESIKLETIEANPATIDNWDYYHIYDVDLLKGNAIRRVHPSKWCLLSTYYT